MRTATTAALAAFNGRLVPVCMLVEMDLDSTVSRAALGDPARACSCCACRIDAGLPGRPH